jgi:predicted signal transduction protein with EAL and GGDEF domain
MTASIGVATYPVHGQDPDKLIKAADEALYAAKEAGRNIVSRAQVPTPKQASDEPEATSFPTLVELE